MKRTFTARIWAEGSQYVAQCVEVEVSSYGDTEEEALDSLKEALELYFEEPISRLQPVIRTFELELDAA